MTALRIYHTRNTRPMPLVPMSEQDRRINELARERRELQRRDKSA